MFPRAGSQAGTPFPDCGPLLGLDPTRRPYYFAYSTARLSRMTVTLIVPG